MGPLGDGDGTNARSRAEMLDVVKDEVRPPQPGSHYTRYGRRGCGSSDDDVSATATQTVYTGFVVGSIHSNDGGTTSMMCASEVRRRELNV